MSKSSSKLIAVRLEEEEQIEQPKKTRGGQEGYPTDQRPTLPTNSPITRQEAQLKMLRYDSAS